MLVSGRIQTLGWIAALLFAALPCFSQPTTLREELKSAAIPETSFSETELNELVNAVNGTNAPYVFLAYLRIDDEEPGGKPHFVRYDQTSGAILRSQLKLGPEDECCLAPENIQFVDDYVLVSFDLNPSASTVLVLDRNLNLAEKVYGYWINRVGKNQIVMVEDGVHFDFVHPGRAEFVDLSTGGTKELYPPKGDNLRRRFARKHQLHMPLARICRQQRDDPCNPNIYDETLSILGTAEQGHFALVVHREANHSMKMDEEPVVVASESALYLYQRGKAGWLYCSVKIAEDEAASLREETESRYDEVKTLCIPSLPVVPDMSTANYSPFPKPQRLKK